MVIIGLLSLDINCSQSQRLAARCALARSNHLEESARESWLKNRSKLRKKKIDRLIVEREKDRHRRKEK